MFTVAACARRRCWHTFTMAPDVLQVQHRIAELKLDEEEFAESMTAAFGRPRYALNLQSAKQKQMRAPETAASAAAHAGAGAPVASQGTLRSVKPDPDTGAIKPDPDVNASGAGMPLGTVKQEDGWLSENVMHPSLNGTAAPATGSAGQASAVASLPAVLRQGAPLQPSALVDHAPLSIALQNAFSAGRSGVAAVAQPLAAPPGDENADGECPVCCESFTKDCMLSLCGHQWCHDCHKDMLDKMAIFKCLMCNTPTDPRRVTHVTLQLQAGPAGMSNPAASASVSKHALKGEYGTKIGAVVSSVLDILEEDADDKVCLQYASTVQWAGPVLVFLL
jgi:hypothetical protein